MVHPALKVENGYCFQKIGLLEYHKTWSASEIITVCVLCLQRLTAKWKSWGSTSRRSRWIMCADCRRSKREKSLNALSLWVTLLSWILFVIIKQYLSHNCVCLSGGTIIFKFFSIDCLFRLRCYICFCAVTFFFFQMLAFFQTVFTFYHQGFELAKDFEHYKRALQINIQNVRNILAVVIFTENN